MKKIKIEITTKVKDMNILVNTIANDKTLNDKLKELKFVLKDLIDEFK